MRIAVVGTGYVGLVAGVCFADTGNDVTCVDTDAEKVARLTRGETVIYEPGLSDIQRRALHEGRLRFTTNHAEAVRGRRVVFIAVGTPEGPDGAPDLKYLEAAVADVARALDGPTVLVLKSTVPVGTSARVRASLPTLTRQTVQVVTNPEFLKEGDAVADFLKPDRVIVGTDSDEAWETMQAVYAPFLLNNHPILRMTNVSAEVTKYASNAMLATRISFMNEIARFCEVVGADVKSVGRGVGTDQRIGSAFLHAGCGYGGSCFPKDTQALLHGARKAGVPMRIVAAAEAVNDEQKHLLADKVLARLGPDLTGRRIAMWGLSYKPRTDDVREAPALVVAGRLADAGARLVGTDPEAIGSFRRVFGARMEYVEDPYEAAQDADALVLCTEWNEYRSVDFDRLKTLMKRPLIFDGRNLFDLAALARLGFHVEGIGRPQAARA
jgi:UDPglucose 6-dehydrogenase